MLGGGFANVTTGRSDDEQSSGSAITVICFVLLIEEFIEHLKQKFSVYPRGLISDAVKLKSGAVPKVISVYAETIVLATQS